MLEDETMTKDEFLSTVQDLYVNREQYAEAQKTFPFEDAEGKIIERLQYWAHRS